LATQFGKIDENILSCVAQLGTNDPQEAQVLERRIVQLEKAETHVSEILSELMHMRVEKESPEKQVAQLKLLKGVFTYRAIEPHSYVQFMTTRSAVLALTLF